MRVFVSLLLVTGAWSVHPLNHMPTLVTLKWIPVGPDNLTLDGLTSITKTMPDIHLVANGVDTSIQNYPYQVSILIAYGTKMFHMCGGVLVKRNKVVTAAHCTDFMDTYTHLVALGVTDLSLGPYNPGSQFIVVESFRNHHRYKDEESLGFPNDLAVLTLETKAVYNAVVQPARLARPGRQVEAGRDCVVTGWGLDENAELPDILQSAYQVSLTNGVCRKLWNGDPLARINRRHICAMFYPTSGCNGDSGGPLTCGSKVLGIVSWGDPVCDGCLPLVYTRISALWPWIKKKLV